MITPIPLVPSGTSAPIRRAFPAILACLSVASTLLQAAPPAGRGFNSSPTFTDEFTANTVNEATWAYRTGARILDGSPQCVSSPTSQHVYQSGGFLRLIGQVRNVVVNNVTYPTVGGGLISRLTFKYGYYETRAKLTAASGWHSSFWLMGDGSQGVRQINEIDGFEIDSAYPAKANFNTHYYLPAHVSWPKEKYDIDLNYNLGATDSAEAFHTYGWEWTPDEVIFYVGEDGGPMQEVSRIAYPGPHAAQNVWLSLLGWERFNIPRSTSDTYIAFDYFRYYAKDYGIGPDLGDNSGTIVASPTYSSGWTTSTFAYDQNSANTSRYSAQTGTTATWTPAIPSTGNYEVFAWNPSFYTGSTTGARYLVRGFNGDAWSPAIDQSMDGQEWISLGAHKFYYGATGKVTQTVPAIPTGNSRTAGMMFRAFDLADCDFDSSAAGLSTLAGAWTLVPLSGHAGNQGYRTYSNGETLLRWTPNNWVNHFVRGSFKVNYAGSNAGLMAHFQSQDDYYLFRIDRPSGTLALLRKSGGAFATLAIIPYPTDTQVWYDLMLVIETDTDAVRLRGMVNGREELAARDTSSLRIDKGTVGVRTYHGETSGDVILDRFGAGH